MNLYDIVSPMTMAEAKTDYQKRRQRERDIDAGKPVPKQRQPRMTDYQKRRAEQKRQDALGEGDPKSSTRGDPHPAKDFWFPIDDRWPEKLDAMGRPIKENSWSAGDNSWSSEQDQWAKENVDRDPINALTGVDEAIGYESNKSYAEVGPYKRYIIYVTKKKFNDKFGFIAVAVNPRTNDAKFKANGATQQEAVAKLQAEADKEIDVATKVSGAATIDFNVDFVRDVLEMSSNTFYAKIIPGPKLVIAGKEMEQYPDIMKQEGFKASSIRTVGDSEGATKLPAMPLSATGATTAQLVANGRYALGAETIDRDGNRIFDLEFDSVVADPRERIRMGAPAITIGTKREAKEDAQIGPDSTSPVGGHVDEGATVAYVVGYFDTKTGDQGESTVSALTQQDAADKIVQLMYDRGYDVTVTGVRSAQTNEGWSNKMVARRTGQAPTPYSVYIKGREWKSFADDDHAEAVANKLRAKFKQEGRDPSVITIAPTGYDKGIAEESLGKTESPFTWIVSTNDGKIRKKFRTQGGAQAYAEREGGKVYFQKKPQGVAEGNPWANVIHTTDRSAEKAQRELKHKQAVANSAKVLKNHAKALDPAEIDLLTRYNLHHRGKPGVRFDRLADEKAEKLIQSVLRFNEQGVDEAYTPAPVKPFRSPRGFNKQGTGLGNKLADLNRKEWEEKKKKEQGVAEGHADQQRRVFKKNGEPVGEVGIDRESSPGNGQWYMKCYAYDIDNAGYDSYEEAVEELKHCLKQGVAEDRGSWIVYDTATKQIKKRFKTHTAGKSYAQTHGLGFASSEYYFDNIKDQKAIAEDEGDCEGLPHLTKELLTHIVDQVGEEGAHAIVKSLEWGDGAAEELLALILRDLKQDISQEEIDETIRKVGSQYRLYSGKGKNLGTFPSRAGAEKHEREVQYFKHAGESVEEGIFDRFKTPKQDPKADALRRELMLKDRETVPDMDDYSWQIGWHYGDGDKDVKSAYSDAYYDNPTIPSPPEPRSFKLGFDARKKQGVAEGIMDVVKQTFNDNVVGWPMGTSDEKFIQGWARDIKNRTGKNVPVEKLAQLYNNYVKRSGELMQSHGTTNEALSQKDLVKQVGDMLNDPEFRKQPADPTKRWEKGDLYQGPGPDDYGYTGYQGHGMPKDKPKKKTVKESYWTKLQNERSTKLNSLVDELKASIK